MKINPIGSKLNINIFSAKNLLKYAISNDMRSRDQGQYKLTKLKKAPKRRNSFKKYFINVISFIKKCFKK